MTTKPGRFLVFGSEAVGDPRADAGEAHAIHAGVDLEKGRRVIVGFGEAGVDEGHVVHVTRDVREDFRNPSAGFAVALELEGGLHDGADLIGKESGLAVEAFELLAIVLFEHGLVIEGVHLALAAVHEEPDDGFCLGRKMAWARITVD